VITLLSAAAVPAGWVVQIANANPAGNTVTVEPDGDDTIGAVAGALTLSASANMVELVSDGVSNWESIRAGTA
jgi:hypothetical protein